MSITSYPPPVQDLAPEQARFRADILRGLRAAPKALPCKYFYDETGSRLFERITKLDEYYPTRSELAIMGRHAPEMAALLGRRILLIEYGSGTSLKTRLLLDHLHEPAGYVPIDISVEVLRDSAEALAEEYPHVEIMPVCADFTRQVALPVGDMRPRRRVVYFPGSTIGNFTPDEATALLRQTAGLADALLLGVDLKKDPRVIEAAYNDRRGVTAAFNLNLLARINRELDGDFRLDQFWHHAFYNPRHGRIEMHLVSRQDQRAHLAGEEFAIAEGESIRTEYSYKYSPGDVRDLAARAGFEVARTWTDDQRRFCVAYLASTSSITE
jgi:dimethylhistidine N-methyltransferase